MKISKGDKHFLYFLSLTSNRQRNVLLKCVSLDQLKLLVSIIYNTLRGNLTISARDKMTLLKYKTRIRNVVRKGITRQNRRARLISIANVLPIFIHSFLKQWQRKLS